MSLRAKARANANVQNKSGEVLKKGNPIDHSAKHFDKSGRPIVGVSIGSTLNMDNYESLRVDVWLTDEVKDSETIERAYERVTKIVSSVLGDIVSDYKD